MTEQTHARSDPARRDVRQNFVGRHLARIPLTGSGSQKCTVHHAISLEGSGASYLPGDALGVHPHNDPELIARIIERIGATGDEAVTGPGGETLPLRTALADRYTLASPSRRLLELLVARGAADLAPLLEPDHTHQLKAFLSGEDSHDILDVLDDHPSVRLEAAEFAATLRSLLPRLYSVASSLKAHPNEAHALVVSVHYVLRGRRRAGVASTWLNDRWPEGATAELYLQNQQKHFALPEDPSTPIIMVGPGTGVAPFRAFIEERRITGAPGRNWLFFGEQRRATDFFYEREFTAYSLDGSLRLDTAFSRDQPAKVYVQHRMHEAADDLWRWLDDGAVFYVCGDKERMAADVDHQLHHIIETAGGKTPDQAHEYVERMKAEKRYRRDVY